MSFKVGDKVVYPHHGAAVIEKRETKTAFGEKREYLVLRLAYGDLILNVPADNTEGVGLREVINDEEVEEVFAVLRKKEARMPTNWSRVTRTTPRSCARATSTRWPRSCETSPSVTRTRACPRREAHAERARQILVSELTFALNVDEETAEERLNEALT